MTVVRRYLHKLADMIQDNTSGTPVEISVKAYSCADNMVAA